MIKQLIFFITIFLAVGLYLGLDTSSIYAGVDKFGLPIETDSPSTEKGMHGMIIPAKRDNDNKIIRIRGTKRNGKAFFQDETNE